MHDKFLFNGPARNLLAAAMACLMGCSTGDGLSSSPTGSPPPAPPGNGSGQVTLVWDSPSAENGQSCPQGITGYRLYRGGSAGVYTTMTTLPLNGLNCSATGQTDACGATVSCSTVVQNLPAGTWHFAITALDGNGTETLASNNYSHTVP